MAADAYVILVPQMLISLVSWLQLLLSINRYRGPLHFRRIDLWALLIFLHAGIVRWVAALSTQSSTLRFQLLAAYVGATLGWISFVIIFNESLLLPTRQQMWSLVLVLIISSLWEVNNRLITEL